MTMILTDGPETGGHLGLIADVVPAGDGGPPRHFHPNFDEGVYVLEGELVIQVGDAIQQIRSGEFALARRGVPHTFANRTSQDARILGLFTPAGFEQYFADGAANAHLPEDQFVVVGPPLDPSATVEES